MVTYAVKKTEQETAWEQGYCYNILVKQNLNLTVTTRVGIFDLLQVYQLGYWAIQSLVQYSPIIKNPFY